MLKAALTISDQLCLINSTKKDGFMTWNMKYFSRNIRLRIWYIFITTTPKKVLFIAKVELPSVSILELRLSRLAMGFGFPLDLGLGRRLLLTINY